MQRSEVNIQSTWNLEDMFATPANWESALLAVSAYGDQIKSYDGKLTEKTTVLECLKLIDDCSARAEMLAVYASMRRDEDTRNEEANARYNRVITLLTSINEKTSFVQPQLSNLDDATLQAWTKDSMFADYDYMLARLCTEKPYILTEKEERILALSHDFSDDFENIFTMIDNADLDFPTIRVDEKDIKITHGQYAVLLQDKRQAVRKLAYEAYYGAYEKLKNTLTANYYATVKKNLFYSHVRGYNSYLEKCLLNEDVPLSVYTTLIESIHSSLAPMHDYMAYRKKALKLDKLNMYDLYTPIVPEAELSVDYDKACEMVVEALSPLGQEYVSHIKEAMSARWIDVYETEGKRSGGYCTHAYRAPHPYILLNYSRTTHDIFTLAHELGHAMHSYYSSHSQPTSKADYRIFVAEVASTVNEMLLLEYLLKTTTDKGMKKFLLSYRLDSIRTTIYRQTMFSEFELLAHTAVETEDPFTTESLAKAYEELNLKYYGDGIEHDQHIRYEWMRIPHFYYSFYVYKYATGLTAAINIASRILANSGDIRVQYQKFLSAGGSKSPYDILCDVGVDLSTSAPYEEVKQVFASTLAELKTLL